MDKSLEKLSLVEFFLWWLEVLLFISVFSSMADGDVVDVDGVVVAAGNKECISEGK